MVQVVLLCAGYGTRFTQDLEADKTKTYEHLIGIPKPLLPIAKKPLISYWLPIFESVSSVSEVRIVINELHKLHYELFLKSKDAVINKKVYLLSDGSCSKENRSGAVACMELGSQGSLEDILFLAGDTLFDRTFVLEEMIARFVKLKEENEAVCLLVSAPTSPQNISKHGIIEVDAAGRVTNFLEKPQPHETRSTLQSPCCYLISRPCLPYIQEFLEATKEEPLRCRDATGMLIQYLVSRVNIFAFPVRRRFDIGNLESYLECCRCYH